MLAFDVNPLEIVVRGVLMYFAIYVLLRVVLRGRIGATTADLLVLVLIADAAQNAMAANYNSFSSGLLLVGTIVGCSATLDWLAFRYPRVRAFVHPERKPLVIDGRMIRKHLATEWMTEEELMTQLRMHGAESLSEVKAAYLEGTGEVSVIKREGDGDDDGGQKSGLRGA